MRDYENTPESESVAYLTLLYLTYLGDLGGSAEKNSGRDYRPMQWWVGTKATEEADLLIVLKSYENSSTCMAESVPDQCLLKKMRMFY